MGGADDLGEGWDGVGEGLVIRERGGMELRTGRSMWEGLGGCGRGWVDMGGAEGCGRSWWMGRD